ncbi:MAG: tetratricopeptide repeat protein [Candidatus Solibacter sp.]
MASKLRVRVITAAAAAGLLIPTALIGQSTTGGTTAPTTGTSGSTSGSTGGTTVGTGTTIGRTPTLNTPTTPTTTPQTIQNLPQPIYVSGRVLLEDGTAPTDPVTIETVCNGAAHAEGYVDSKGYFSVELGRRSGMIQDASETNSFNSLSTMSVSGGMSSSTGANIPAERKYMGCDLQARLAGHRSQSVSLTNRRPMDNPDVGTILLHRLGAAEEGKTVSAVSLAAPKDARKAYDKGMDALKKRKFADAQASFEKAVEVYPKYASVWYELGMLQAGQGQPAMARKYFDVALEHDPKFVKPYMQIANLEMQASRWPALAAVTEKLVKLDPFDYPQAYFFNSVANFNMQKFDAAEKSALEAERLDTQHKLPRVSQLLGLILAVRKDYPAAAERFKTYLKLDPNGDDAPKVRKQLAEIEKVTAARAAAKD